MELTKQCQDCGAVKKVEFFPPRKNQLFGVAKTCRQCLHQRKLNRMAKAEQEPSTSGEQFLKALDAADPVNSPDHYRTGGIECIDAMVQVFGEEAVRTYARINAFKYVWRHQYKGKPEEDLAKAAWYTRFADGDDPRKETNK
ncbi:MAG TPA: DUF3310 domain-containing protein [Acidimicrobiia bacterium]